MLAFEFLQSQKNKSKLVILRNIFYVVKYQAQKLLSVQTCTDQYNFGHSIMIYIDYKFISIWRLFESLLQLILLVQWKYKLLVPLLFVCVWNCSAIKRPTGQEITDNSHPDHRRYHICSLTLPYIPCTSTKDSLSCKEVPFWK